MKKILLTVSIGLLGSFAASAQSFEILHDTMTKTTVGTPGVDATNEAIYFHDSVKNVTATDLEDVKWRIIESNLPLGWYIFTFCDNVFCRSTAEVNNHLNNTSQIETFAPIAPGTSALLEPSVVVPQSADDGTGIIKVRVFTDSQTDTAVFIINKTPVGINQVKMNDSRVSLFPNPSAGQNLNVFINKDLGAKSVAIYNVLGAQVAQQSITREVSNVATAHLANGHYLVKVLDQNGLVITTRKWVK